MRKWGAILQVACTYIGTVVGAGFASGQEILQFFTRYGAAATAAIGIAAVLFVWFGIQLMLLANQIGARSYEDLNHALFGPKIGRWISLFSLLVLLGVTSVMLAGAGTLFSERFGLSFRTGMLVTALLGYFVIARGIRAILAVNTVVVPVMLAFVAVVVWHAAGLPGAGNWLDLPSAGSPLKLALSPFLYVAFNLALAQAVLVPLGSAVSDRSVLFWGGLLGGAGIGVLLFAAHFALSAQMPEIAAYEIPMGQLIAALGTVVQIGYLLVIYSEIFTTLIADVYGLQRQLAAYIRIDGDLLIVAILMVSFLIGQVGFSKLLGALYPMFGAVSLVWLAMMVWRRSAGTG